MDALAAGLDKVTTTDAAAPSAAEQAASSNVEQKVTPWDVEGGYVDGKQVSIDYEKLIKEFGTRRIDDALLKRFESLTGRKPHPLLRRGSFFSHRELDMILTRYEQQKPFYLYTGRGPSSVSYTHL